MSDFPSLTPKELIKVLEKHGFVLKRINGSHHYFFNPENRKICIVPMHTKDIPKGTLFSILKQAGISKEDLKK